MAWDLSSLFINNTIDLDKSVLAKAEDGMKLGRTARMQQNSKLSLQTEDLCKLGGKKRRGVKYNI